MIIAFAMGSEQTQSLIKELQECLARGAVSVILYTTDDPAVIELMHEMHIAQVPPTTANIPSPDIYYSGIIWPLAFNADVVAKLDEERQRELN